MALHLLQHFRITVLQTADYKLVEMVALPPHHRLQYAVQPRQCSSTGDLDPTPDRRFTPLQRDFDLIHDRHRGPLCPSHLRSSSTPARRRCHAACSSSLYSCCSPPRMDRAITHTCGGSRCRWVCSGAGSDTGGCGMPGPNDICGRPALSCGTHAVRSRRRWFSVNGIIKSKHSCRSVSMSRSQRGIRLGTLWRRFQDLQSQVAYALIKLLGENAVAVMNQEAVGMVSGNRFAQLLEDPRRGRIRRDIGMYDTARGMFHNDEDIEKAKGCCHHHAEVTCDDRLGMMTHKSLPSLRRRAFPSTRIQALGQIRAYGAWGHA